MANSPNIVERGADGIAFSATIPASQPGDVFPAGVMLHFAGGSAPTGWLICDGAVVSRATYPNLFTAIGTTFGAGDGSTTFGLPDTRGKVPVSKHSSGTFNTLGATGGEETHALSTGELASHAHTASSGTESADHTHSGSTDAQGSHQHAIPNRATANGSTGYASGAFFAGQIMLNGANSEITNSGGSHSHNVSTGGRSAAHTHAITVDAAGSGTAHNNLQPYIVLNHIIRAY